ncbi:MAG: hypothetical protein L6300_17615 [Syntrophaceae bacterium]|nr:hypothetical protein [Syntrophaceae bacterium]
MILFPFTVGYVFAGMSLAASGDDHGLITVKFGPFQFDGDTIGLSELRTVHANRTIAEGLVSRTGRIYGSIGFRDEEWVGILVQRMGCNALRCAAGVHIQRLNIEMIIPHPVDAESPPAIPQEPMMSGTSSLSRPVSIKRRSRLVASFEK